MRLLGMYWRQRQGNLYIRLVDHNNNILGGGVLV